MTYTAHFYNNPAQKRAVSVDADPDKAMRPGAWMSSDVPEDANAGKPMQNKEDSLAGETVFRNVL